MLIRIAVFALLVALANTWVILVPCGLGEIGRVTYGLNSCNKVPCHVVRGQTYKLDLHFATALPHTGIQVFLSLIGFDGRERQLFKKSYVATSPDTPYVLQPTNITIPADLSGLFALRIQIKGNDVLEICSLPAVRIGNES